MSLIIMIISEVILKIGILLKHKSVIMKYFLLCE